MKQARLAISAAAAALILAACGGGPNATDTVENSQQVEDHAASTSIAGLIAFAKTQIASFTNDAAEPRSIKGINPPTSDTAEPQPL